MYSKPKTIAKELLSMPFEVSNKIYNYLPNKEFQFLYEDNLCRCDKDGPPDWGTCMYCGSWK